METAAKLAIAIPMLFAAGLLMAKGVRDERHAPVPAATAPTPRAALIGRATIIDGDTIDINGERVRLHGIDAPARGQRCAIQGDPYPCGQQAALELARLVGEDSIVCERNGQDRYGRTIARCLRGSEDLARALVVRGWALSYRKYSFDYVEAESQAKVAHRGVWAGTFQVPEEYRRQRREGTSGGK